MKRRVWVLPVALSLVFATAAVADSIVPLRNFDRFEFDTGTVNGMRVELQAVMERQTGLRALDSVHFRDRAGKDLDSTSLEGRLSIGGDKVEVGVVFPYRFVDDIQGDTPDQNDVGDIRLYMKLVPLRTEYFDAGLGYDFSMDSGDAKDGFGYGAPGHLPFLTATAHCPWGSLNGHVGYRFVNHSDKNSSTPRAVESFVYGAAVSIPFGDRVVVRTELVGQNFDLRGGNVETLALEPGLDVAFRWKKARIVLRPTIAVGLNDETSDLGFGTAVAVSFPFPGESL